MPIKTAPIPRTQKLRSQALNQRRALKMAASPNAYVRGNTTQFYAWLEEHDDLQIPHGPDVWICGDCHFGNLGPVSNNAGDVEVQIRDLDQTVIGNPTHDIIDWDCRWRCRRAAPICPASRPSKCWRR